MNSYADSEAEKELDRHARLRVDIWTWSFDVLLVHLVSVFVIDQLASGH